MYLKKRQNMNNIELDKLRTRIDEIDKSLCQLIIERQSLASKIMDAKKGSFPFDPKREEDLIKKLVNFGLDKFLVEKVWRQIISSNLSMQKIIKIGVAGNDDEIKSAYLAHFGNYFKTTYFSSVVSLLASLEKKDIELGFIDSESIDKLKKQTEMRLNFDVIANVPLYKNVNQKDYSIVKLKNEEI